MFVIKVCDDVKIVGHLSIEISRPKKYLLDRGAVFTIELTFTNNRLFPLIQGGLEIPAKLRYDAWNSKKPSSYGKVQRKRQWALC